METKKLQSRYGITLEETRPGSGIYTIGDIDFEKLRSALSQRASLEKEFRETVNTTKKWATIRRIYKAYEEDILQTSKENRLGMVSAYLVNWSLIFTPIEYMAWFSIRSKGLPFYPQYPIGNVFIDFANPYMKIGVEMDGKDFHDYDKDLARDTKLKAQGWKIFRISGSECYKEYKSICEIEDNIESEEDQWREIENWLMNTSDGVFEAIDKIYFHTNRKAYYGDRFYRLCLYSLNNHRLTGFKLPSPF